jgi:hypothetical protein
MRKSSIVRGGGRRQDHFGKAFDAQDKVKSATHEILRRIKRYEITFNDVLALRNELIFTQDWYKNAPRWVHAFADGYMQGLIFDAYTSQVSQLQESAHVFRGKLYRKFEDWRREFPDLNGSELRGTCVSVYKSGKVYSHYPESGEENRTGQTLPFAE